MLDKMKQLMDMQKKMQELKRELENANFEALSSDGLVKIIMNGAQELKDVTIQQDIAGIERVQLEKAIKDAYSKAVKRAQEFGAQKMKEITGSGFPGLT